MMSAPIRAACSAVFIAFAGLAQAAGILPMSGTQQLDNATGTFLNAGKVFIYLPTTTTCASIFSDLALTAPLACPVILNSAGRVPAIYAADGLVRVRILNSASVLQFDEDNVSIVTAASGGGAPTPIPDSTQIFGTRDLKVRYDDQPLTGYVRLNGRTIGSATSGATERANADVQSLFVELWSFANISVVTGKGATAAADWAANKQLTLPDMAGRFLAGKDDMGNGAAGRITAAVVTGPTVVGASGGTTDGTFSVAQANLPNVNFTHSGTTVGDTTAYTFTYSNSVMSTGGITVVQSIQNSGGGATITPVKTGSVTVTAQGTAASGGSATAIKVIPPVMLFMFYIKI